jgi:hypothetical protein
VFSTIFKKNVQNIFAGPTLIEPPPPGVRAKNVRVLTHDTEGGFGGFHSMPRRLRVDNLSVVLALRMALVTAA